MAKPLFVSIILAFLPAPALSWSQEGHRTIAIIAQRIVAGSPANANLNAVLGGLSLADIATCPDEVRELEAKEIKFLSAVCAEVFPSPPTHTEPWHFVNTRIGSADPATAMNTACGTDCVLVQIKHFSDVLKQSADRTERLQALAFVVHFVGDVHQPLHAADRNGDAGGNAEVVTFSKQPLKLHGIWDKQLVAGIDPNENALATALAPEIAAVSSESPTDPNGWALQSFQLAGSTSYKGIPTAKGQKPVTTISTTYIKAATPVIRLQLARAGVRLAAVLESALQ